MVKYRTLPLIILILLGLSSICLASTPVYTYPANGDLSVSAGYQEVVIRFSGSEGPYEIQIQPETTFIGYNEPCEELVYHYVPSFLYTLNSCQRLRIVLDTPLKLDTTYSIQIRNLQQSSLPPGYVGIGTLAWTTIYEHSFHTGFTKAHVDTGKISFGTPARRRSKIASVR